MARASASSSRAASARGKAAEKVAAPIFEQDSDEEAGSLNLPTEDEDEDDSDGSLPSDGFDDDDDDDNASQGSAAQDEGEAEEERRFAQFVDEDDLEDDDDDDDSEEEDDDSEDDSEDDSDVGSDEDAQLEAYERKQQEKQLKQQMKNIPFSALMKARQQLSRGSSGSDDNDSDASIGLSDLEPDEFEADRKRLAAAKKGKRAARGGADHVDAEDDDDELENKRREVKERLMQLKGRAAGGMDRGDDGDRQSARRREREESERKELEKRANKHAPTEMSSRKPVSRRREVIETASSKKIRDPRFDSLSGSAINADLFAKSYSFLPGMQKDEIQTLRALHQKLRKQEANQAGPKAKSEVAMNIRQERQNVEMALRRAEGLASERDRRNRETEVKRKIKRQNKERVEKGLNPFYVKKSEQKAMVLKEKYDRLAGTSGDAESKDNRKSLKKALERRRKKNVQKERKDMPVGMSMGLSGAAVPKRKRDGEAAGPSGAGQGRSRGGAKAGQGDSGPPKKRGRRSAA